MYCISAPELRMLIMIVLDDNLGVIFLSYFLLKIFVEPPHTIFI